MSKLRSFLQTIDPDTTIFKTERCADAAFNSFDPGSWIITKHDEFLNCLGRFFCHVEVGLLHLSHDPWSANAGFPESMARSVLTEIYGPRGEIVSFEMASQGVEGGLYRVLKDFASQRANYYINKEISNRVCAFLNTLSIDERSEVAEEYAREYGHLLPHDYTEGNARKIKINLDKILSEHPNLIVRMRQVGRV